MKNLSLILIFGLLTCIACNSNHSVKTHTNQKDSSEKITIIDFERDINNEKEIYLSDIADSIFYIPLETTPEFLIGDWVSVKASEEFYFIGQFNRPVGVFNKQGKFLHIIGKIGKGPKEYSSHYFFEIEESTKRIFFINSARNGLIEYSWDGSFIRNIKTEKRPQNFSVIKDSYLLWSGLQDKTNKDFFNWAITNDEGKIIKPLLESKIDTSKQMGYSIKEIMDGYRGKIFQTNISTLYRFEYDTLLKPVLNIKRGKYKIPYDPLGSRENNLRFGKETNKYILGVNVLESQNNWYIWYYHSDFKMGKISKGYDKLIIVKNPDLEEKGVYNDIDGGPSFWPMRWNYKGKYFYKIIPAIDMISILEESKDRKTEIKNPKAAEQFQKLASSLNENDNPILMVVKLK